MNMKRSIISVLGCKENKYNNTFKHCPDRMTLSLLLIMLKVIWERPIFFFFLLYYENCYITVTVKNSTLTLGFFPFKCQYTSRDYYFKNIISMIYGSSTYLKPL